MFSPLHSVFNHATPQERVDSAMPTPPSSRPGPSSPFSAMSDFFDFDKFDKFEKDFPQEGLPKLDNYDNFVLMPRGFEFSDLEPVNISRYHLQPVLSQLNEITRDNKFPLDRKIDPASFTSQRLGDYMAQQLRYERLLKSNPDGLRHGLETVVKLASQLEAMPASHDLNGLNTYAHQRVISNLLCYALEKTLDNPYKADQIAQEMLTGVNAMARNAKKDSDLKIEEKILSHIEQHDQMLEVARDIIRPEARSEVQLLPPESFELDAHLHQMLQNVQKQRQAMAAAKSPNAKAKALKELEENELKLSAWLRKEEMRHKELLAPIYTNLSEHLREKCCRGFVPQHDSHPLKHMAGFRHLWESLGGDRARVLLTPFDLQTQCEPAWFLNQTESPFSLSSVSNSLSSPEISDERLSHQTDTPREVQAPVNPAEPAFSFPIFGISMASA